jgi:4-cresol dehydrogenase (hydroxylating)
MAVTLPPGVSESALQRACAEFAGALGPDAVLTSEADLAEFRDPYTFAGWDTFKASAVVLPGSTEEVQAVVRIANAHRVPLWTFSQGRNNAYGGAAPRVSGSVVVNLRRMNRVLEVSDELAYAVVEPGVRFFDLYDHLRAGGHRLWISVPDQGWGSVTGNAVDHGRGYTHYGDHAGAICGMELVLANGEVLRTGMGAMDGNRSWHVYQRGFGPSPDGLFMQSNLGIVTKVGVWLTPQPECLLSCWVRVEGEEGLAALIDTIRPLLLDRTVSGYPLIRKGIGFGAWDAPAEVWGRGGEGGIPRETFQRIFQERNSGWWAMRFAVTGHEEIAEAQFEIAREALSRIPGAQLGCRKYLGDEVYGAVNPDDRVNGGVPGMEILDLMKAQVGETMGHLDFSPVAPLRGSDVLELGRLLRARIEGHGVAYAPGLIVTPRCVIHVTPLIFDTRDEAKVRAAFDACAALIPELKEAGFGLYRTHLSFMDQVAEQYDFNDGAQMRFYEKLKDALDPNGILAPGKQGIWPAGLRAEQDGG